MIPCAESTQSAPRRAGWHGDGARGAVYLTGLNSALTVSFLPLLFNRVTTYDDEGFFLASLREFMRNGSLYVDTKTRYGPFYYSLLGTFHKILGTEPTPFLGRAITLAFTALAALLCALAVWRATSSIAFAVLCEVTTFVVLVRVAGNEPMHPGSLTVLLLAALTFVLVEYAVAERSYLLVVVGCLLGALLMTKINIGIFACAAVAVSLAVGNPRIGVTIRRLVVASVLALPTALTFRLLWQTSIAQLVALTTFSLLVIVFALSSDRLPDPQAAATRIGAGVALSAVASVLWPLSTGTTLSALFDGVVTRALKQTEILVVPPTVSISLSTTILAIAASIVLITSSSTSEPSLIRDRRLFHGALAFVALWSLALVFDSNFASWLPAAAMLPCLAALARSAPRARSALRLVMPLAVLQVLHAYPVAGSQRAWATALVLVPCTIAAAAGVQELPAWHRVSGAARGALTGALCLVIVVSSSLWPVGIWRSFLKSESIGLPGTSLIRTNSATAQTLRQLTKAVQQHCDTFYSAPVINSLYFYSGLPNPTGLLPNWPGVLNASEQRQLAGQLADAEKAGKRVCIVRDLDRAAKWESSSYGTGPLGQALANYTTRVASVTQYTVSVRAGT